MFSLVFFFVLIFFSPFSIVITSLGGERAGLCASCASIYFTRVNHCPFSLPLSVRDWLRLVIVEFPGLFCYTIHVSPKLDLRLEFSVYTEISQNRYKMEIDPDKTKVMTNNPNGFQREIKIKEVENFKYLGAIISNEGSKPEILSRIAQTTAALSRLKIIWRDKNVSLASKVKLMRTLILSTFLHACEGWTLTAEIERRVQALGIRCYRRLLDISYKDHVTNEEVRNRIQNATGVHDDLLTMVKKRKLRWYGHISRSSGMAKTILQGTVKGARRRGRQKKWERNGKITSRNGREWALAIP